MSATMHYFTQLGPLEFIGVAGFFCYLFAFGSVQIGWMDGNSTSYSLINILAATLVAISLTAEFNLSSALIQGSWIVIGCAGVLLRLRKQSARAHRLLSGTLEEGTA